MEQTGHCSPEQRRCGKTRADRNDSRYILPYYSHFFDCPLLLVRPCRRSSHSSEPTISIFYFTVHDLQETLLQLSSNRAGAAAANRNAIDAAYGRDLRRGSREEYLVGRVQCFARHILLVRGQTHLSRQ